MSLAGALTNALGAESRNFEYVWRMSLAGALTNALGAESSYFELAGWSMLSRMVLISVFRLIARFSS